MKLNVYGKKIEIVWSNDNWLVLYIGSEGKKRIAEGITIPSSIQQDEVIQYLADLFHESATPSQNKVFEIT